MRRLGRIGEVEAATEAEAAPTSFLAVGRDRGTARASLGQGLAVSAFPLYVPV
jgi:hypothetical protein